MVSKGKVINQFRTVRHTGKTVINMSILDLIKFGKPLFDEVCAKAKNSYEVEKSISGSSRLYKNGKLIHDYSACEDVQEEESAYSFFAEYIKEYDEEE